MQSQIAERTAEAGCPTEKTLKPFEAVGLKGRNKTSLTILTLLTLLNSLKQEKNNDKVSLMESIEIESYKEVQKRMHKKEFEMNPLRIL
ncbi:hypothetical protein CW304_16645 [Bacillus sp. UFRGS-B20]|nr:hypothetical protein CW304_16645 [Bacillus sp. UFRGS-B20]